MERGLGVKGKAWVCAGTQTGARDLQALALGVAARPRKRCSVGSGQRHCLTIATATNTKSCALGGGVSMDAPWV